MKRFECPFEAEALDPDLRAHVSECPICSDVVTLAAAFDEARQDTRAAAAIPDSGHAWRAAQLRARREDAAAAMRPITAAQVIALGCAFGVAGACFGATSTWFQSMLPRMLPALVALAAGHAALIAVMAAITVVVPTLVYLAATAD